VSLELVGRVTPLSHSKTAKVSPDFKLLAKPISKGDNLSTLFFPLVTVTVAVLQLEVCPSLVAYMARCPANTVVLWKSSKVNFPSFPVTPMKSGYPSMGEAYLQVKALVLVKTLTSAPSIGVSSYKWWTTMVNS